jgi:hypothetical protein
MVWIRRWRKYQASSAEQLKQMEECMKRLETVLPVDICQKLKGSLKIKGAVPTTIDDITRILPEMQQKGHAELSGWMGTTLRRLEDAVTGLVERQGQGNKEVVAAERVVPNGTWSWGGREDRTVPADFH